MLYTVPMNTAEKVAPAVMKIIFKIVQTINAL